MVKSKAPVWFWIIAILALLWNMMGVGAFIAEVMSTPESMAELYTADQLAFIKTYPSWTKIFYGIATLGGFVACVGLLMRKRWALGMFVISFLGVIVQQVHAILFTDAIDVFGPGQALYFPIAIIVISIFMIWFTKTCIGNRLVA